MPHFRIRASDGKVETVFEEQFRDEARLREVLPKRGWNNIISVEEIAGPSAAVAHGAASDGPIPVAPGQVRVDGDWVHLAPEIASQHPLYGIGGWAALLFALMALGVLGGAIAIVIFLFVGEIRLTMTWLYLLALVLLIWEGFVTYLLLKESENFPKNFIALSATSIVLLVAQSIIQKRLEFSDPFALIGAAAWTLYVVKSRRINVSCRKRVARNDPFLRRLDPPPH